MCCLFCSLSGCAPQVFNQRVDGGRLRLHHPELADIGPQVIQDLLRPGAAGLGQVLVEQAFQVLEMGLHRLRMNAADVDQLVVVTVDKIPLKIKNVGESAGKSGAEVDAGTAEHTDNSA